MGGNSSDNGSRERPAFSRLLIVKMSSIGDVIHALPIATILKQNYPGIELGWVVRKRCAGLLEGNPDVDHVNVIPDRPKLADLLSLTGELRKQKFEVAIDMQGLLLSGLVTWLSGARRRIGLNLNREQNALFLTEPVVPAKADRNRHAIDILRGFLPPLGIYIDTPWPDQPYLAQGDAAADMLPGGPQIALNVGASSVYKQWPVDRWTALAKRLVGSGSKVVLVGGPQDVDAAVQVEQGADAGNSLVNIAGKTSLRELGHILKHCDVVVTADTGPMHLAVAVGTPTVALFGPTNPVRTGPYGDRHTVIWKSIACSPCYRKPTCEGRVNCMKLITPDEVFDAVMSKLSEIPAAGAK